MKGKHNEWIAISDLMAGVMAVVMLLLVVSVLQKQANDVKYKEELARLNSPGPDPVVEMTLSLKKVLDSQPRDNELMVLDLKTKRLTLRDGVFERGSACLTPEAKAALSDITGHLGLFLLKNPRAKILIEGHTDSLPVNRPVIDYQRFCTVYDDNFTLSAARAREARKGIIGSLDELNARRIVVAGYGDSVPLPNTRPDEAKNRRVEVQFLIE